MSVLSTRISQNSKPHVQISPKFLCLLPVAVAWTLFTSSFVDDVVFSYDGANGPESTTTLIFRPFRQDGRPTTLFGRVRQLAASGAKSAVLEFILFLIETL